MNLTTRGFLRTHLVNDTARVTTSVTPYSVPFDESDNAACSIGSFFCPPEDFPFSLYFSFLLPRNRHAGVAVYERRKGSERKKKSVDCSWR